MIEQKRQKSKFPKHFKAPILNGCGQGCVKMIVHYFEDKELPVDELNEICAVKTEGAFSGVFDIATGMAERGYEVIRISDITPEDYGTDPLKYMRAVGFDPENPAPIVKARKESVEHYLSFVKQNKIENRPTAPSIQDIRALTEDGFGLICWVNSSGQRGDFNKTTGHYIVPIGIDEKNVIFHDPGYIDPVYGASFGVGIAATHDLFLKYTYYPDTIGLNPDTQKPYGMGLLAFRLNKK